MIMKRSLRLVYVMLFVLFVQPEGILKLRAGDAASVKDNDNASADRAWNDICNTVQGFESPSEWLTNRPTPEVLVKFRQKQADSAVEVASKAREFYTRFPDDARALKAKTSEREMLAQAERLGNVSARVRLVEIDEARLNDPSTGENERFEIRLARLQRETRQQTTNGMDSALDVYAKGARLLLKDFPKRDEPYEMLLAVAMKASEEKTRLLAREIVEGGASEAVKAQARAILKKLERLGKPLDLKFTALDGREVDLSKMKGKVVLVDFWATWSGPYAAAWPQHKIACEKWQSKGCAVVGISFDKEKEVLETFLAREKVGWPQYFDGQGWKNKIGLKNGIRSLPSLWLVDKKGILRDQNAADNFEQKMEMYLAEP
jgi:thiol-disulfide isomerase/thioredoxin